MTPTQELILDCYRSPQLLRSLADRSIPLPEGLERMLRTAAAIDPRDAAVSAQDREFLDAVLLFVRTVVLVEGADHYRNLGLRFNATREQIDNHYRLLLSLLAHGAGDDLMGTSQAIGRVSRAYAVLSQPRRRRDYDKTRFGTLVHDEGSSLRAAIPQAPAAGHVQRRATVPREAQGEWLKHVAHARVPMPVLSNRMLAGLSLFALLVIVAVSPVLTTQFSKFWFPQRPDIAAREAEPGATRAVTAAADSTDAAHTHVAPIGPSWITPSGIVEAQLHRAPPPAKTDFWDKPTDVAESPTSAPPEVVAVASVEDREVAMAPTTARPDVPSPATAQPVATRRRTTSGDHTTPVKTAKAVVTPVTRIAAAPAVSVPAVQVAEPVAPPPPDADVASATIPAANVDAAINVLAGLQVQHLNDLMARLSAAYRAGDAGTFMELFADDAHTNDQLSKRGINDDYRGLFESTDAREFSIDNLRWQVRGNAATGEGRFVVRIKPKWKSREDIVSGRLKLEVEQRAAGMQITGLYHDYQN